jgi:hypothetical protein
MPPWRVSAPVGAAVMLAIGALLLIAATTRSCGRSSLKRPAIQQPVELDQNSAVRAQYGVPPHL